jgi:hypothetical protein
MGEIEKLVAATLAGGLLSNMAERYIHASGMPGWRPPDVAVKLYFEILEAIRAEDAKRRRSTT